jgi:hypothetical protein
MIEPSKETRILLATFMAVSAGVVAGCSEEGDSLVSDDTSYDRLKDDSGKEYTLVKNGDGTETAKYDDGESVTFKRDDDGNLNFVAGSAGLLAGLAAGYFLWHGLSPSGGHYDSASRSYRPSSSVSRQIKNDGWKKYDQEKEKNRMSGKSGGSSTYVPSSNSSSSSSSSSSSTKSSSSSSTSKPSTSAQSKSSTPSTKSSVSAGSTKSGFGGSGARSSAAS